MGLAVKAIARMVIVQKAIVRKDSVMTAHAAITPRAMAPTAITPLAMEPARHQRMVTQNPTAVNVATGLARPRAVIVRPRAAMRHAVPMVIVPAAIAVSAASAVSAQAARAKAELTALSG